jgi:hypothetical protein
MWRAFLLLVYCTKLEFMYPLLVQGVFSNSQGTQRSLLPGAALGSWNNVIKIGRGDLIAIDPISTNITAAQSLQNTGNFTYYVSGQQVIDTGQISNYVVTNKSAGSVEILSLRQPGGQSIKLAYDNLGTNVGAMVHHYFENKFAIPSIIQARMNNALKPRIKTYSWSFANGTKLNTGAQYAVPTGLGNVVAVEVFTTISTGTIVPLTLNLFSISIGGTTIFEDANAAAYCVNTHRPIQILPILIRPGETFTATADTSDNATVSTMTLTLKLYFDDDYTGTRKY